MTNLRKFIAVGVLFCFVVIGPFASAEESTSGTGADFSVEAIYPENQRGGESGYFNLKMDPGAAQTIKTKVRNDSDKTIEVTVQATRATTSDGGVISYKEFKKEKDASIVTDFNDIVTLKEQTITIPAKEEKEIEAEIKMPDKSYEGEVLGALHFSQKYEPTKADKDKTVVNTFSYSIPIELIESDAKVENKLELKEVEASQRNFHNYIEATIQNQASSIIHTMTIDGSIRSKSTNEVVYNRKEDSYQMAPNSTLKFGFDMQDTPMVAGQYQVELAVEADGKKYNLSKEFTISSSEAKKFNDESVYLQKDDSFPVWLIAIIIGLIILVIGGGIFFYIRKKKQKIKKNNKKGKKNGNGKPTKKKNKKNLQKKNKI